MKEEEHVEKPENEREIEERSAIESGSENDAEIEESEELEQEAEASNESRREERPESEAKDAEELIEEAREMVEKSDSEIKNCMQVLDEDIEAYEESRSRLLDGSVEESKTLLEEVGFESDKLQNPEIDELHFEPDEAVEPMYVQNLPSGRFGAFLLALIAALAVTAGWLFAAVKKLGMTLDLTKVPDPEVQQQLLSWIGGGITGGKGNPTVGMAVLGVSAVIVMWIVYKMRVYLRAQKNLHLAQEVKKEAKFYCTKKEECKKEMDKVSAHIHEVSDLLHSFKIFFDEQNAKIRRILHVEGKRPFGEYHLNSKEEIKHTYLLISSLNELISTPMADEQGSVSDKAKSELKKAEHALEHFKERLYE